MAAYTAPSTCRRRRRCCCCALQSIDVNGDGTITADELRSALKSKGSLLKQEVCGWGVGWLAGWLAFVA